MQSETTTAITAVKQDVHLREWAEQLEAQQASGLTVPQWCAENGIKTKSFYYRLRRVREQYIHLTFQRLDNSLNSWYNIFVSL
ncbi:MAG: hypothetical protein IKQ39_07725 [Oscillospiraceae bacterium]|nr:hypothetical protein [Oscillospiraceae bacterium]